jgi:hypothetical protein
MPVPNESSGKCERRPVELEMQTARLIAREQAHEEHERCPRRREARDAAGEGKHARFGEQLSNELPTRGAERQPDRHLGGAISAARQQQVGDVRAGDEKHDTCHAEEEHQRTTARLTQRALAALSVGEHERSRAEARHGLRAHAGD